MIEIVGCLAFAIQGSDWRGEFKVNSSGLCIFTVINLRWSPPESPPYGWLCYAVDETSAESFDQIGVTKD